MSLVYFLTSVTGIKGAGRTWRPHTRRPPLQRLEGVEAGLPSSSSPTCPPGSTWLGLRAKGKAGRQLPSPTPVV